HYNEKILLQEMAKRYFMQSSNFARLFKQKTGRTFNEYLWELRLKKATKLIGEGKDPILEIISKVCTEEPAVFYRQFKLRYHMTPMEYKKYLDNNYKRRDNF
ncbi:MAG: AraC family transcriptional regulator, partial [Tissierellia bacterium]|nr:AraC family transcriptional regulator [Tissierellia bacterium]